MMMQDSGVLKDPLVGYLGEALKSCDEIQLLLAKQSS